ARGGDGQASVLHALGADESIRDTFHYAGLAPDDEHLQTVVMIQVNVQRGKDMVEVRMLQIGQFLVEQADMVVVNQGDGADHVTIRTFPRFLHEFVANQIAEGFRAVVISAGSDQPVELLQKLRIYRYANAAQHTSPYYRATLSII